MGVREVKRRDGEDPDGRPRYVGTGRWQASYRDATGRRHTKVWPTRTAAKKWAQDGEAAVRQGVHRDPRAGRVTLRDWHARWAEARVVEDATRRRDRTYSRDVLAAVGPWPLDTITRMEVQGWVRRMEKDGRGPSAIGVAVQLLTSLLEDAVREGKLPANPARGVRLPRTPEQPDRLITPAEEVVLLEGLPTAQDRRMVEVLFDTGLRYGELAGLHAHRVDMLRRELHVVEVLTQAGKIKAYPKSRKSRRRAAVSDGPRRPADARGELAPASLAARRREARRAGADPARLPPHLPVEAGRGGCRPGDGAGVRGARELADDPALPALGAGRGGAGEGCSAAHRGALWRRFGAER
jgi:integrase